MTREELHIMALQKSENSANIKPSMTVVKLGFVTQMLEEIQSHFEQRVCETCKHWNKHRECMKISYPCDGYNDNLSTEPDFGCNEFERKIDE